MENPDILNSDEQIVLLDRLLVLTKNHTITWQRPAEVNSILSGRNDVRAAAVGHFLMMISSADGDGVAPFQLFVLQSSSDAKHLQMVGDIRMRALDEGGTEDINTRMAELYQLATQRSMRARQTIDNLFDELDKLNGAE